MLLNLIAVHVLNNKPHASHSSEAALVDIPYKVVGYRIS